jgi:hypothetical protein
MIQLQWTLVLVLSLQKVSRFIPDHLLWISFENCCHLKSHFFQKFIGDFELKYFLLLAEPFQFKLKLFSVMGLSLPFSGDLQFFR